MFRARAKYVTSAATVRFLHHLDVGPTECQSITESNWACRARLAVDS